MLHDPAKDPDSHRPHVHLIVRAQGANAQRLNPRKADLARWREAFADQLMERGVAASATRRQTRGVLRIPKKLLEYHARGNVQRKSRSQRSERAKQTEDQVLVAWQQVAAALMESPAKDDRVLGREAMNFIAAMPAVSECARLPAEGLDHFGSRPTQEPSDKKNGTDRKPDRGRER